MPDFHQVEAKGKGEELGKSIIISDRKFGQEAKVRNANANRSTDLRQMIEITYLSGI